MHQFWQVSILCAVLVTLAWVLSWKRVGMSAVLGAGVAALIVFAALVFFIDLYASPLAIFWVAVASVVGTVGIQGKGLQMHGTMLGRFRFAVCGLSVLALSLLIYLALPIATFMTSPGEIGLHLEYLTTVNARDAMICIYSALLLYALAPSQRLKTAVTALALGLMIVGVAYSFIIPFGYPTMTGLTFEMPTLSADERTRRWVIDLVAIFSVGSVTHWVLVKVEGRTLVATLAVLNVSLVSVAAASVVRSTEGVGGAGGSTADGSSSLRPLYFTREGNNALLIFLDRFMGSYVESALEADPELAQRLSGFVWYPRTISAGQNSIAGVHPMFGGYDYTPLAMNARDKLLRDMSVEAFSILPHNFSQRGYQVNVVNPRGLGFTMAGDCSFMKIPNVNCTHVSASVVKEAAQRMGFPLTELSRANYVDLLMALGAMRAAPYSIKLRLHVQGPWRKAMDHSAGTTFREWAELKALPLLSQVGVDKSTLNIISNILPHEPYYLNERCVPQRSRWVVSDDEVARRGHLSLFSLQHENTAHCVLYMLADYMDSLRDSDVYDNTKIVIVSDHGIVGKIEDNSSRAVTGGTQDGSYVRTRSVLLVKDRGATGPLKVSEEFMPNAEVPRILCMEVGGCVNPYLNNAPIVTDGRDDPFQISIVPWQFTGQKPTRFVIQRQFELHGKDPFNAEGWKEIE